jgi:hypothetical protein
MKFLKMSSAVALVMFLVAPTLQAYPSFTTLANKANGDGANINKSNWNTTALTNDSLWNASTGSAVKFKSEISGYKNTMGYADSAGNNSSILLNEGSAPGAWITLAPTFNTPFTFYLNTNQGNEWFSKDDLNADASDHLIVFQRIDASENKYLLFWDDQNTITSSDRDYNDFVARVDFVSVPEPGTLAILGLSLIGIGFAKKRKA